MSVLSIEATIDIYMERNILIPRGARTCRGHLTENYYIKEEDIEKIPIVSSDIVLTNEKIKEIFESSKNVINKHRVYLKSSIIFQLFPMSFALKQLDLIKTNSFLFLLN